MGTPSKRQPFTGIQASLGGRRFLSGTVGKHDAIGPQFGVEPRDAIQVDVEQRRCGDGPVGQHPRLLSGAREGEIAIVHFNP